MTTDDTANTHRLENPIDVMPLVHKAFRAVSDRTETLAAQASTFEDVAALNDVFANWIKQIVYHAGVEDEFMTGPLKDHRLLETEEAMVLPLIRECLPPECQLEAVGALLIDRDADDQNWVIDWISQHLTDKENELLLELASSVPQPQLVA